MDLNVYSYPNLKGLIIMTNSISSKSPQEVRDILNDPRFNNAAYHRALFMAQMAHEIEKLNQPNIKLIF